MFHRAVVDTSTSVSAVISPGSTAARSVHAAFETGEVLRSSATIEELREVLARPKFQGLRSDAAAAEFIEAMVSRCKLIPIIREVRECRDLKDDKFLEVALNGSADVIISGDVHLLEMHPWRGIAILKPMPYLASQGADDLP